MEFGVSGNAISSPGVLSKPSSAGLSTKRVLPSIKSAPSQRRSSGSKPQPETSPRIRASSGGLVGVSLNGTENVLHSRESRQNSRSGESVDGLPPRSRQSTDKPLKMTRAKAWSPEVENLFRFQAAGFRDLNEYVGSYDAPEQWVNTGFVKCLQVKANGYYMYFRQDRECEDKYLHKIKIYSY